jgi:Rrf2 family protein
MLSRRAKYALKALAHFTRLPPGTTVIAAEIADVTQAPRLVVGGVLHELRNAGILISRRGTGGGFSMREDAREMPVGAVIRLFDGSQAPLPCVEGKGAPNCDDCGEPCAVRSIMIGVRDAITEVIQSIPLSSLAEADGRWLPNPNASFAFKKTTNPVDKTL